jgi:tyrosinase
MKTRALNDPTGWRFYGAIHGIDQNLWQQLGYLNSSDPMPSSGDLADLFLGPDEGLGVFVPGADEGIHMLL